MSSTSSSLSLPIGRTVVQYAAWPAVLALSVYGVKEAVFAGVHEVIIIAVVLVLTLAVSHILELVVPLERRSRDREGDRVDLLNIGLTGVVAEGLFRGLIGLGALILGVSVAGRPESGLWQVVGLDRLPWLVEFFLAMVILDLPLYWHHRWMHTFRGLWSVHTVHHSPTRLAAISAARNHLIAPMMTASVSLAFGALGPSVDVFVAVHAWIVVKGWLQHANVDLRTPGFDLIFPTPRLHRFHHSTDRTESASNFGILTVVWDHVPWHRLPVLGRYMAIQRTTWFAPHGRLAPDAVGSDLVDHQEGEGALATWKRHMMHPLMVWKRLPSVQNAVQTMGWPVGVLGAVLLAHRLVGLGLAPGLVAALTAGAGIAWAGLLQWLHPMATEAHPSSPDEDGGWKLDLLHLGLSEGVGHAVAQASLSAVGLWLSSYVALGGGPAVWCRLGLDGLPLPVQFAVAMLVLELGLYWQHRLFHEVPAMWETHKVHHAVRSYGPTRAARHHPLSPMVTTVVWTGFALLGAPVEVFVMAQAFAASNGALQHCGADLRIGRLDAVFAGPAVHRWHHARDLHDRNFGPNLTVWDRVPWHRLPILRHVLRIRHVTFYRGAEPGPAHIGLEETLHSPSNTLIRTWADQVLGPFVDLVRGRAAADAGDVRGSIQAVRRLRSATSPTTMSSTSPCDTSSASARSSNACTSSRSRSFAARAVVATRYASPRLRVRTPSSSNRR